MPLSLFAQQGGSGGIGEKIEQIFRRLDRDAADLRITLLDGRKIEFKGVKANRYLDLDLSAGRAAEVAVR